MLYYSLRVSVDWLEETEMNNEWMCEEDYSVDETGEPETGVDYMTSDEFQTCFEKPKKKKPAAKKRKRKLDESTSSSRYFYSTFLIKPDTIT